MFPLGVSLYKWTPSPGASIFNVSLLIVVGRQKGNENRSITSVITLQQVILALPLHQLRGIL
jgi:hypothetical protein